MFRLKRFMYNEIADSYNDAKKTKCTLLANVTQQSNKHELVLINIQRKQIHKTNKYIQLKY